MSFNEKLYQAVENPVKIKDSIKILSLIKFNIKATICLCIISVLFIFPAYGFDSSGDISKELSYSNVRVYRPNRYHIKVQGYIRNKTDYKIYLSSDLIFHRVTGTIINTASIVKNIKPRSSTHFDIYLEKDDNYKATKEALHLKWDIEDLNIYEPYKASKSSQQRVKSKAKKSVQSSSIVREGGSSISITGNGKQNTDAFALETGKHSIKIRHYGHRNFIVQLRNEYGRSQGFRINKIGTYNNKLSFYIDRAGNYFFDVEADGEWSFAIERPNRVASEKKIRPVDNNFGEAQKNKYRIELLDGRVYKTSDYLEKGSEIIIKMYGAQIFFEKAKIKEIKEIGLE